MVFPHLSFWVVLFAGCSVVTGMRGVLLQLWKGGRECSALLTLILDVLQCHVFQLAFVLQAVIVISVPRHLLWH